MAEKFTDLLKFNKGKITDSMKEYPSWYYFYAAKKETAKRELDEVEDELEEVEARLGAQTRTKYSSLKNAPSESHIKDLVKSNPERTALKEKLRKAKKAYRAAGVKLDSLKEKKDMMINAGHDYREEKRSTGKV